MEPTHALCVSEPTVAATEDIEIFENRRGRVVRMKLAGGESNGPGAGGDEVGVSGRGPSSGSSDSIFGA